MDPEARDITALLTAWRGGDEQARDQAVAVVYHELKELAHRYLRAERPGHTLQTTALVHEVYLKLSAGPLDLRDRAHFLAVAARQLRYVLLDYAKASLAQRRGHRPIRVPLLDLSDASVPLEEDIINLHDALQRFETLAPRPAQVVELRFFAGMTEQEISEALDVSVGTVKRDWRFARSWLISQLGSPNKVDEGGESGR